MSATHEPESSDDAGEFPLRGDLTRLQRDLLFAIAHLDGWPDAPEKYLPSGAEVKREVEDAYGELLKGPTVYDNLGGLNECGLVAEVKLDGRTVGRRLTEPGVGVCERQLQWEYGGLDDRDGESS